MSKTETKELGVGVVGYGFIGRVHTFGYTNVALFYDPPPARIKLVGVCTAHRETAEKGLEHGYQFATTDYRELLDRKDIHIISCCTPNYLHKDELIQAVEAGKHVYCDKPLAMNLKEAREIVEAAKGTKATHQMTFEYRFIPAMMRAKQLVEEGFLGDVFSFRAEYLHSGYIDPNRPMSWRLDKKQGGGGALFDLGSHVLDLVRFLLGEAKAVYTVTEIFTKERPVSKDSKERAKVEVDDLAIMMLRMENGAMGTVEVSRVATGTNNDLRLQIYGRQGSITFDLMDPNWLYAYDNRDAGEPIGGFKGFKRIETVQRYPAPSVLAPPKIEIGWLRYHIASQYDFIRNVVDGKVGHPNLEDGMKVQELMEAGYKSAKSGKWVELPLL
jgi:predicted dehydrogenase